MLNLFSRFTNYSTGFSLFTSGDDSKPKPHDAGQPSEPCPHLHLHLISLPVNVSSSSNSPSSQAPPPQCLSSPVAPGIGAPLSLSLSREQPSPHHTDHDQHGWETTRQHKVAQPEQYAALDEEAPSEVTLLDARNWPWFHLLRSILRPQPVPRRELRRSWLALCKMVYQLP